MSCTLRHPIGPANHNQIPHTFGSYCCTGAGGVSGLVVAALALASKDPSTAATVGALGAGLVVGATLGWAAYKVAGCVENYFCNHPDQGRNRFYTL